MADKKYHGLFDNINDEFQMYAVVGSNLVDKLLNGNEFDLTSKEDPAEEE